MQYFVYSTQATLIEEKTDDALTVELVGHSPQID